MNRQLTAVLLTYATRRAMQLILGGGGIIYALAIFVLAMVTDSRTALPERVDAAFFILAFPAGFIAYLLATQAKWQFVDPRARLLPRFATPHLAVILGVALVGLLFMPGLAAIASRLSLLGYLAFNIAFAASFIWSIHGSGLATIVFMIMMFTLWSDQVRSLWILPSCVAQYFPLHLIVFVAGWAAFAAWLLRLSRLNEESDDYNIPVQAQYGSATRMERSQASRNILRHKFANGLWKGGPSDWWHDRLRNYRTRSFRERQRLFRYGFAAIPAELNALWFATVMLVILVINSRTAASEATRALTFGALAPMVFLPAMFPGLSLAMRRARLTQELLLPLSRTQFINGVFLELARQTLVAIIAMLAFAIIALVALPADFPETSRLLAGLVLLAAVQPYFFGVATYSARWQSAMARLVIAMAAMMPVFMACSFALIMLQRTGPLPTLLIAAAVFPVGVLVAAKSRQAWLNAELA